MLLEIVQHPTGQDAGARGQDDGAFQTAVFITNLDPAPKDARPKAGEKRHGLGGLNQQRRVEGARGNAGVQHQDWSFVWFCISDLHKVM
jgi:hypothetical protein